MIRWKLFILLFLLYNSTQALDEENVTGDSNTTQSLLQIQIDPINPSTRLYISIPKSSNLFDSFVARVVDVTSVDDSLRDEKRTFREMEDNKTIINVTGLHAGHKYSIEIIGQKNNVSNSIKEESIVMRPVAPNFSKGNITSGINNISMTTNKEEKAVQDHFLIKYAEANSDKLGTMEVIDIETQPYVDFFIAKLKSGTEYTVSITSISKDGQMSLPWKDTISTAPSPPYDFNVEYKKKDDIICVSMQWKFPSESGLDHFYLTYSDINDELSKVERKIAKDERELVICGESLKGGIIYNFNLESVKGNSNSTVISSNLIIPPLDISSFNVIPDLNKGQYRLSANLKENSKYESCHVEISEKKEIYNGNITDKRKNLCWIYLNLTPGEIYSFNIWTSANTLNSTKKSETLTVKPAFGDDHFGTKIEENEDKLSLMWPKSEQMRDKTRLIWDKIVGMNSLLILSVYPIPGKQRNAITQSSSPYNNTIAIINNLKMGACYQQEMYTKTSNGIISDKLYSNMRRISPPDIIVNTSNITANSASIRIALTKPKLSISETDCVVNVLVIDTYSSAVLNRTISLSSSNLFKPIDQSGLRSHHQYTLTCSVVCGPSIDCDLITIRRIKAIEFQTAEDLPGPVQNFDVVVMNPYSVNLSWEPPALANGNILHYKADIRPLDNSQPLKRVIIPWISNDTIIQKVIDELEGGLRYEFIVYAVNSVGDGIKTIKNKTMSIAAPPKPTVSIQPEIDTIESHELFIKYSSAIFNARNGRITKYSIIVAEVTPNSHYIINETSTWSKVSNLPVWPPYVASVIEPSIYDSKPDPPRFISIAIGNEKCEDLLYDDVCNGALRAGRQYRFKLRLYTANNLSTDSDYSQIVETKNPPTGLSLRAAIFLLLLLVFIGLSGVLFISYWNKSKKVRNAAYSSTSKESQWAGLKMMMAERAADCLAKLGLETTSNHHLNTNNYNNQTDNTNLHPTFGHHRRCRSLRERTGVDHRLERLPSGPLHKTPLYTVISGVNTNKSRPVRISDFQEHVNLMSADSDFRFSEEYELLKNVGICQSFHAAELPSNRTKNRFTNILPYDHSRVRLIQISSDEEGSDYINANYMPGFSGRREFIAAQGPLPSTRDAFWQMIWEQQCPSIIALTKCVEKGRDKCHQYWPDSNHSTILYGQIEVTLLNEVNDTEFTIRELRLVKEDDGTSRIVRHFHYMAWPDFGVPQHPDGIINFCRLFRSKLAHSPNNKPTVVHCSAGVGRSGTFISIDRLLHSISLNRPIDVFGLVQEMRMERCHMVQNEQQYIFIHHCILRALLTFPPSDPSPPSSVEIHQNPIFQDDHLVESGF